MKFLKKTYQVKPNTEGYLYRDHKFEKKLGAGYHDVWDLQNRTSLFCLPLTAKLITVTNQEVLTKDNIALRFSFNILYRIVDGQKFLGCFSLDREAPAIVQEAETRLYNLIQIYLRQQIALLNSESLNENRDGLTNLASEEIAAQAAVFGMAIDQVQVRDLTFPKAIQDLFAKLLEAKIRSKSDLENARTAVAAARAFKNAADLMKDDDNIKFFQLLETLGKIAEKGRHTFMVGDIQQFFKK